MADEDKNTGIELPSEDEEAPVPHDMDFDEEYHFKEEPSMEAFTAATTPPPANKTPKKGLFSRKSFLFIVAVVIVAIAGYKFLGTLQGSSPETPPNMAQPKPFQPQQSPQQAPQQQSIGMTTEQLNALQNRFAQTDTQISALGNQVTDLANSVTAMQANLTTLSQQVQALSVAFQEQQVHLEAQKAKPKPKYKKHYYKPVYTAPKPIYQIEAIIPDRAWLRTPDGTSITVTVGSPLYGYGVVKRIDAVKGLVITSSGAIIRYNGK